MKVLKKQDEIVTLKEVAKCLDEPLWKMNIIVRDNLIKTYGIERDIGIDIKLFEEWKADWNSYIPFYKLLDELIIRYNSLVTRRLFDKLRVYTLGYKCFGARYSTILYYKSFDEFALYIKKEDKEIISEELKDFISIYNRTYEEKLSFLLNKKEFTSLPLTRKYIDNYYKYLRKGYDNSYLEAVNYIRLNINKELIDMNEEEISDFVNNASRNITKTALTTLVDLLQSLRKEKECKFKQLNLKVDKTIVAKKKDVSAYDVETYLSIAYMCFNSGFIQEQQMVAKAVESAKLARVWLYHAMNLVCDWRKSDIENTLPRISLPYETNEMRELILIEKISVETYKLIAEEVEMRINYLATKPQKIRKFSRTSPLRIHIAESYIEIIGMLFAICEIHCRTSKILIKKEHLCQSKSFSREDAVKLFGEDYKRVFKGRIMSNLRINKQHMSLISEEGNKLGTDGYLIAAYARSHTGGINTIPEVTARYVTARMDGYTVNDITRILFERGVCSFVPYLFAEAVKGTIFTEKCEEEKTKVMNALSVSPMEIEKVIETDERLEGIVKGKVHNILEAVTDGTIAEVILEALKSIANGESSGKNTGIYCLKKACKKGCTEENREICIGCGYEIYTKAFIFELINELKRQERYYSTAKSKAEKYKRKCILEKRLYPAVYEVMSVMKNIYHCNIEEFKTMLLEGE
ncbi:hypothetical protein QTL86_02005 [Cellulosilyticum sp. ST5]|uniref:hypothetical protein n=1 Tax=Cellulosilyticum sp. ST5 TaxID=3055805 RepID=UPI003977B338